MDCIDRFLKDIHVQQFYNGTLINPTRFFLVSAMLKSGKLKNKYEKRDLESIIYRYYAENPEIAKRHPRLEIRNIVKHGVSTVKEELKSALETWVTEASEQFLSFDLTSVYLDIDINVDYSADVEYLKMVLEELYKKTYRLDFPKLKAIDGLDTDLIRFGQGVFRAHLMEEMQYCVCCDEYNTNKLFAVHILPDAVSDKEDSRDTISNGLLMCYEHAQEYLHARFYFDENGRIVNLTSSLVHRNMRLGLKFLTEGRKKYLKLYQLLMKKG